MDHDNEWSSVFARLRGASSVIVSHFEVGPPATADELETLSFLEVPLPPPPIVDFYRATNGVRLQWAGRLDGLEVAGSVNIVPLMTSAIRAPASEGGEPLEDVLWNDEFEERVLADLKRMAIFEQIAGTSDTLTYFADATDARLFLVHEDEIRPIIPDFETTIGLLKQYAGADGLRDHLTRQDWRELVSRDDVLQRIARL